MRRRRRRRQGQRARGRSRRTGHWGRGRVRHNDREWRRRSTGGLADGLVFEGFPCGTREDQHLLVELDLIGLDDGVHSLEKGARQVLVVVDAPVVRDELVEGHLVRNLGRVQVRVEHDDRKGEHVRRVTVGKDARVRFEDAASEGLHQPIDLLRLPRQSEGL